MLAHWEEGVEATFAKDVPEGDSDPYAGLTFPVPPSFADSVGLNALRDARLEGYVVDDALSHEEPPGAAQIDLGDREVGVDLLHNALDSLVDAARYGPRVTLLDHQCRNATQEEHRWRAPLQVV